MNTNTSVLESQITGVDDSGNTVDVSQNLVSVKFGQPTAVTATKTISSVAVGPGGIGNNTSLQGPTGAAWGSNGFTLPISAQIKHPFDDSIGQTLNGRINGTFWVYKLTGSNEYLVIYSENGEISPGQLVENGNDARGWFLAKFNTQVAPYQPNTNGAQLFEACHWYASSPSTVNQNTSHQDMAVDTTTQTVEIASGPNGLSSKYDESQSTQIWNSNTYSIADWGINETSDASQNRMSWEFHQQMPFEVDNVFSDFKDNWKSCYSDKTDLVKVLSNLSTHTLQYSTTSLWKFNSTQNDHLVVEFRGLMNFNLGFLNDPKFRSTSHHQLRQYTFGEEWAWSIDLVKIVSQGY